MSKILAIRYIVYRVAQEFNKFHGKDINDVLHFNESNDFTLEKCMLLPYIITIANGNKNFFLEGVFKDSFFPDLNPKDKKVIIGKIEENNFSQFTDEDLGLEFNDNGFLVFNFSEEEFNFDFEEGKEKTQTLKYNINYSIKFFIERRYKNFATLEVSVLKKITYQNDAFEVIESFFSNEEISNKELVEYFNHVAIQSFYFTYLNKRIENDIDVELL